MTAIPILTKTQELDAFCKKASVCPYVTVDTEFLRERTYYSKLCLVQLAIPSSDDVSAVLVDPLSKDMDLAPLLELFQNEAVVKVFHSARQDLEIFQVSYGVLPRPLFDTQVAAMVCGFGEQVGYETLARQVVKAKIDKSSRFTDWSKRPLSAAQQNYALADVTHLRGIYEELARQIETRDRGSWVEEEIAALLEPSLYETDPAEAWKRVKTRNSSPRFLALVAKLAEFRERHAQSQNVPRSRVMKDDAVLELAALKPRKLEDLSNSRMLQRDQRKGVIGTGIIDAVNIAMDLPKEDCPTVVSVDVNLQVNPALAELLRVLLRAASEASNVAPRLIASAADLNHLAAGKRDIPALQGWRAEVFGQQAEALCDGKIALAAKGERVDIIDLEALNYGK